jgi:hypothetical protein
MQEDESGEGMLARLAVNGDALSQIENGLREICKALRKLHNAVGYTNENIHYHTNIDKTTPRATTWKRSFARLSSSTPSEYQHGWG